MTSAVANVLKGFVNHPGARRAAMAVVVLGLLTPLVACEFGNHERHNRFTVGACPRPQTAVTDAPQFNDQQRDIRQLREHAFAGDFFAQIELAHRYGAFRATDKNLEDPVEAATWYALALANSSAYERMAAYDPHDNHKSI